MELTTEDRIKNENAPAPQYNIPAVSNSGTAPDNHEIQSAQLETLEEVDESDSELSQLTESKLPHSPVLLNAKQIESNRSSNNSPIDFLSTSQASLGSLSSSGRPQLGELKPPTRLQSKSLAGFSGESHQSSAPLRPIGQPHSLGTSLSPKSSHKLLSGAVPAPGPITNPRHINKMSPSKDDPHSLGGLHHLTPHAPLGVPVLNKLDAPPLGEIKHSPRRDLSPRMEHSDGVDNKELKDSKPQEEASPIHSTRALGALNTQHSPSGHHKSIPSPKHSPLAPLKPLASKGFIDEKVDSSNTEFVSDLGAAELSVHQTPVPAAPETDQTSGEDASAHNDTNDNTSRLVPVANTEVTASIASVPEPREEPASESPLTPVDSVPATEPTIGVKTVSAVTDEEPQQPVVQAHSPVEVAMPRQVLPTELDVNASVSASQESPLLPPQPEAPPVLTVEEQIDGQFRIPPHTPVRGNLGSGSKASRFNRTHTGEHSTPPPHTADEDVEVTPTPLRTVPTLQGPPPLPLSEVVSVSNSRSDSPRTSPRISPRIPSPRIPSPRGQGQSGVPSTPPAHTSHLSKKHSQSNMSVAGTVTSERTYGTMNRSVHSVAQPSSNYEASYNKAASDLRAALINLDADVANTKTIVRNIFRKFGVDEHAELTVKELKSFVLSPELGLFSHDDPRAIKFTTMLMEQIDINGDGSVSLNELETFLWPRVVSTSDVAPVSQSNVAFMFQSPWEKAHKPTDVREIGIVIDFTRTAVRNHVSSVAALGSDEAILQEFAKFAKATLKRNMLDTRLVKKAFLNIKINEFGRCLYQQEVDQLVASIDCNDDGVVSATEFKHWLFPSLKQEETDTLSNFLKKILNESFGGDVWQMFRAFCNGSEQCYKPDFVLVLKAIDKSISKQEALAMANKISGSDKVITMAHMLTAMGISAKTTANADTTSTSSFGVSHSQSGSADDAFGTPRTKRRRRRAAEKNGRLSPHVEESGEIAGALFADDDGRPVLSKSLLSDDLGEQGNQEEDDCSDISDDASELSFDSALEGRSSHLLASSTNGLGTSDAAVRVNATIPAPVDPATTPSEREKQRVRELLFGDKGKALQAILSATNASFSSQLEDLDEELHDDLEPVRRTVGLTPTQLTALGYAGHTGRWRGHPYDTWSCCNTALMKCPFGDETEAFSPGGGSPHKIRTSLDSSTGSLFYKAKATPFIPAGRSPAKSSVGEIRESSLPPPVRRKSPSPRKPVEKPARTQPSPAQLRLAAKSSARKFTPSVSDKPKTELKNNTELLITPSRLQTRQPKPQPQRVSAPVPAPRRVAPTPKPTPVIPSKPVASAPARVKVTPSAQTVMPPPPPQVKQTLRSAPYVPQASAPVTATFVVNVPRSPSPLLQPHDVELFQQLNAAPPVVEAQRVELKRQFITRSGSDTPTTPTKVSAALNQANVFAHHSPSPVSKAYVSTLQTLRDELNEARVDTFQSEFEFHSALREEQPTLRIHQELLDKTTQEGQEEHFEEHKETLDDTLMESSSPHHMYHDEWARYQSEEKKVGDKLEIEVDRSADLSVTGLSFQFASRLQTALHDIHDIDETDLHIKYGAPLRIGSVDSPYLPDDARSPNKYYRAPPERKQRSHSAPPTRTPRASNNGNSDSFFSARAIPPRAVVRDDVGAVRPVVNVSKASIVPPMRHPGAWLVTSPLNGISFYRTNRQSKRNKHASPQRARSLSPTPRRRDAMSSTRSSKPGSSHKPTQKVNQPHTSESHPAQRIYPGSGRDAITIPQALSYGALPDRVNPDRAGYDTLFAPPSPTHQPFSAPLPSHLQFPPPYVPSVPLSQYQPLSSHGYHAPPSPAYTAPYSTPHYPQYAMQPTMPHPSTGYMHLAPQQMYSSPMYASALPSVPQSGGVHAIDTWWENIRAQKRQHEIHGYESVQSSLSNKM